MRCVITGASGFIGRNLCSALSDRGYIVLPWTRRNKLFDIAESIDASTIEQWQGQLRNVDVVIHLAGIAHRLNNQSAVTERQYALINTEASIQLAQAALAAGVRRFIFISTAKVFGEGGPIAYSPESPPQPEDAYALSKWQAEQRLRALVDGSAMELVIIRPPLVYGAHAKANFALLQKLARLPLPLPFAALSNQRDLIALHNLIDLIYICIDHPNAVGGSWLCADAEPYSLGDMVAALRKADKCRPGLFSFPPALLKKLFLITLGKERAEKIVGDFRLDCTATRAQLNWFPKYSMRDVFAVEKSA
jgi:nucleoside-diphosphate-sugar epimerase